ncbi:MAG: hypothetical protein ACRC6B_11890 [Fusobacteriaceae bacterium]
MSEIVRDNTTGRFLPGTSGRKKGSKSKITERMLIEFMEFDDAGGNTPFKLWRDILAGKHEDRLNEMPSKDSWAIVMKASELMAKYVYDASFETDEAAAKLEMSVEQIEALKSAFPGFKK